MLGAGHFGFSETRKFLSVIFSSHFELKGNQRDVTLSPTLYPTRDPIKLCHWSWMTNSAFSIYRVFDLGDFSVGLVFCRRINFQVSIHLWASERLGNCIHVSNVIFVVNRALYRRFCYILATITQIFNAEKPFLLTWNCSENIGKN